MNDTYLVFLFLGTLLYLFYGYHNLLIARRLQDAKPWLSFVPFANIFQLSRLAIKKNIFTWSFIILGIITTLLIIPGLSPNIWFTRTALFAFFIMMMLSYYKIIDRLGGDLTFKIFFTIFQIPYLPMLANSDIKSYRQDVKEVFSNIFIVYKNFIHWTLYKILLFLYAIVAGLIISAPLLVITVFLLYKVSNYLNPSSITTYFTQGTLDYSIVTAFVQHMPLFISVIIIGLIIFMIFLFTFIYSYFLQQNVFKNYLEGIKLPFTKNYYYDWRRIYKFLGILSWVSLYLLVPVLIFAIYMVILLVVRQFAPALVDQNNIFFGMSQILIIGAMFIYFIYVGIRLSFSYLTLLYSEDTDRTALSFVKEGLMISKGKVWKFIGIGFPFLLISIFLDSFFEGLDKSGGASATIGWLLNLLLFSSMGSMIYISLYRIISRNKNILKTEKRYDDDGFEEIEPSSSSEIIDPIISSPKAPAKPAVKKEPAKKPTKK